jgi:hypothetical protein
MPICVLCENNIPVGDKLWSCDECKLDPICTACVVEGAEHPPCDQLEVPSNFTNYGTVTVADH